MDNLTQQQIDTLIQNINDATDPASVTNIMVANVLAFLAAKVKTMATASDLSTEATARETVDASLNQAIQNEETARQNADTALSGRITSLQDAFNTMMNGNVEDAIESFNEVINFLSEVTDEETLTGLLTQINNRIASVESNLDKKADLDNYTDKLSYDQAPDVVLASMGSTLDNVNNDSTPFVYIPGVDDVYWDDTTGHIKYVETTQYTRDLLGPKAGLIYCNKQTNLTYRWKGAQGWQQVGGSPGNSVEVVDDLQTGGRDKALSAEMGKRLNERLVTVEENGGGNSADVLDTLESNSPSYALSARQGKLIYDAIQLLVASIRPSAFWDGAPEFDWVGQVTTYNVTYNLTGCGKGTSPSVVAEGGTLVAVLSPNTGYTLDGVTPTVTNSNNVAVTHNTSYNSQTGSLTITVSNVQGALIIGATAVVLRTVDTTGLTNLSWDGPTSVRNGGTLVGKIEALGNYALPSSTPTISGTHGTVTWNSSTGQLTVANVTSNIGIAASGRSAFSVNAALTNCSLDNTNGVMPGGTYEGTLSPKASDAPNATVTWGISSVVVKMGSSEQSATEVQNAYNSSTGEITVPNVTGNLYITAVAESSVKIYRGKGLTMGGYPSSDSKKANFCYIDDIVLPQGITPAANDVIHWQTGYKNNMLSNYRDPLTLTFIGSDGKCIARNLNLNNSDCDFIGATYNGVSAQTLGRDVTIGSSHISAFPDGFKIRASFFMNSGNTDIYDGAYLSYRRNGVELARLFTAEQGMTEGTERTIYPVTVERDASQVDYHICFNAITGVFAGDKLYIKFVAKSGYKIDSIDVTMGRQLTQS